MKTRSCTYLMAIALASVVLSPAAYAYEKGDWLLRAGVGHVSPKSDAGVITSVDSSTALVINATYFISPDLAIELLAASPFSHDINLASDGTKVGEAKQLPPTLSMQYHFNTNKKVRSYVGVGLNYTLFFDEKTTGPLAGIDLDLEPSIGLAAQLGADMDITESMHLNFDIRWMDIDTEAELDGVVLEGVEIDPLVYSLAVGWRF